MDDELAEKLEELQLVVDDLEKLESEMEVLDATFLGINQKDPEQLKLFEEDEKKILDAYQMKKATLLALKQEVRRLELKNNNRGNYHNTRILYQI
jgi:hypothetical protein